MSNRGQLMTQEQWHDVVKEAIKEADLALWREIKRYGQDPDTQKALLAEAQALEKIETEIYRLIQEHISGDTSAA